MVDSYLHEKEVDKWEVTDKILCRVIRGGRLSSRKSIAVPGLELHMPTLTEDDNKNIKDAAKYGVTGVMLPFVRNRDDLVNLKEALLNVGLDDVKIYAKIENMDGVNKLPSLIEACDEIVIARGDLGNAVGLVNLPAIEEDIARTCREHNRAFMVVTEMLASMIHKAVPTRAEVMDIYSAVRLGASSVMLTGETATGDYPKEAMDVLVSTSKSALLKEEQGYGHF